MASSRPKIQLDLPVDGIRADLDDFHLPASALRSTSFNWLLREGKIVTRPGHTAIGQDVGNDLPLGIISFDSNFRGNHLVFSSLERWWRYNNASDLWEDISDPLNLWSGVNTVPVSFRAFSTGGNTFLLGVNGTNPPLAWDADDQSGTNKFVPFGGNPPTARCIAIVSDRVLLGHLVTGPSDPSGVDVSAFQDHTSGWGVTQTATLVDSPGFIVSMNELGANRAAIYKTESIYLASGTTGLAPIRFDIKVANISGPINTATVVPLDSSVHAIFARDNHLYFFDGINYTRHPSSERIRTLYEENAATDTSARLRTHAHYNRTHNELWWFYTRAGLESVGPRDAIILNLTNGSVWRIDFTRSSFSFTSSYFGSLVLSDSQRFTTFIGNGIGSIFLLEGSLDSGNSMDVLLETGLSDLGVPTQVKTIEETEHYFASPASSQTPSVSILTSESGKDPDTSAAQALTVTNTSSGPYVTGHRSAGGERVTSRFVGIRIEDDSLVDPLEYRGSSVTIAPRGSR